MSHVNIIQLDLPFNDPLVQQIARAAVVITKDGVVIKDRRESLDGPVPRVAYKRERDTARRAA
jgi:hypothetical protein